MYESVGLEECCFQLSRASLDVSNASTEAFTEAFVEVHGSRFHGSFDVPKASTEACPRHLPRAGRIHGTFHVPGESTEAASTEACMEKASTETSKVIFCRGLWIPVKGMGVLQNFEKFRLRVLKSQKFRALWHGRTELTEVPVGYKKCCTRTPRNVARGVQDSNMFQVGV